MKYIGRIEFDDELDRDKYYIYGIGYFGSYIYEYLNLHGRTKGLMGFVDSYKFGIEFNGYTVKSIDEVLKIDPQVSFIVGGNYKKEILDTLRGMNISNVHLILE